MACCRKNATPVFLLLLVVFIFHFDLTHPAAVINEFAGSGRPVVLPTAGAPNAHPPKDEASSSGAGDGDGDVSVAEDDSGARPEKAPCVNCEHQRSMDALRKTHGENELVQIRLEVIKEQILAKLRMTSPPSVHFPRTKLPLPLLYPQGEFMQNDHPSHSDPAEHDSGRFYGEPKQLIVFGKQGEYMSPLQAPLLVFI
ncbi:hypothetical protein NP493_883g00005 [Ridgeia piscesae]|uniref:Uncharacterized protein n=1 Tax=Ridgeia piscesae TaxID=27915 RepID=A0AAD9KMV4_RIDPI|nr:hypothetical protein NP493_883g00005 [Ridgeia piscesae]